MGVIVSTDFSGVIKAWRRADPSHIHPLKHVSDDAYWASGVSQAEQAAQWIPDKGTVIDFGCGDGRLSLPLSLFGYKVIAVDASLEMLKRLLANQRNRGGKVFRTVQSDGLDLAEVIDEPVDAVVCRAVLIHHSHADVAKLVASFSSVLKPGGVLIADWPLGNHHERRDWIDVTTWELQERQRVADANDLSLVNDGSVWRKG